MLQTKSELTQQEKIWPAVTERGSRGSKSNLDACLEVGKDCGQFYSSSPSPLLT